MPTIILATLLSIVSLLTSPAPEQLKRHDPKLQESTSTEEYVTFEQTIPQASRENLRKYLSGHFKESRVQVYRMLPAQDLFLAFVQKYDDDSQNIFLLLRNEGEATSEMGRINPDVGCMIPTPTLFNGSDRTLVIVAIAAADGGFCGNYILEYKDRSLKYLGDISVYDGVHGKGGFQGHSPFENRTLVEFKQDTYYITMRGRGSLYDERERRLARPRIPITYFYNGKTFQLARAARRR